MYTIHRQLNFLTLRKSNKSCSEIVLILREAAIFAFHTMRIVTVQEGYNV